MANKYFESKRLDNCSNENFHFLIHFAVLVQCTMYNVHVHCTGFIFLYFLRSLYNVHVHVHVLVHVIVHVH